jgi:colanic acid biosynthesis glycosyl transferase WcaI
MPHLWLVSHNYAPEATGIPVYNTGMAEWFVRRGWQVTVLTGLPHYPWWRVPADYAARDYRQGRGDEVQNGVMVRRVRHFVPSAPVSAKARMRLDASYLAAWCGRSGSLARGGSQRPDVIVGVAPPFLMGALLMRLRHLTGAPVVYHVQDLQVDAALDLGMLPGWLGGALRAAERWQLAPMDLVTACGAGMLPRIVAKGPLGQPPRHWPNWADVDTMKPWDEAVDGANPERAGWQVPAGGVVGLYSGNLGRKQGVEVLIEATRRLSDVPQWRTIIAGAGAERQALAQAAATVPACSLEDLRPVDRLRAFLAAGDVHVIPQRREAADLVLPSKLLNILAVGKPVVVTADPGTELHRVVTEARCGLAVTPEDPAALAGALATLAKDAALRAEMGRNGRQWITAHLSQDAVLGRIEQDLLDLIAAKRRAD